MIEEGKSNHSGHPWHKEQGWEILEAKAETKQEIDEWVKQKKLEYWNIWIIGNSESGLGAALYRPLKANRPWKDGPETGLVWL